MTITDRERARGGRIGSAGRAYQIGDVLSGTYELKGRISDTRGWDLYEAVDRVLGREVSIKAATGTPRIEALRREARMLAPLAHPGLVAIHGYGVQGRSEYLVQEKLSGTTLSALRDVRAKRGGCTLAEAVEILIGICEALAVLHAAGHIHGDLHADSVVLASGRIVVRDPVIVGEPVPGEGGDRRADLYALGVIGYELLAGQRWHGDVSRIVKEVPLEAAQLIRELLETRAADATLVAAALRALRRTSKSRAARPIGVVIADDDPDVLALLALVLRAAVPQAVVHTAQTGVQAIELVEEHRPDVLFLDIEMPDTNGLEVCLHLRGTRAHDGLAICVMSHHAKRHRAMLSRLGVLEAFQKGDMPPAEMPAAIAALFRRLQLLPAPTTPAETTALVGGRYEIVKQLGKGGMGTVYEVRHSQLGRPFALKAISPDLALDSVARARFHQEARLASEIVHPNIVSVVDYGEDRTLGAYMVMERVDGEPLAEMAKSKLSIKRACDLLGQITDALEKIHAQGIVHGDVKAENILVVDELVGTRRRRVAKLLDFGLARRMSNMKLHQDVIYGTPQYIAPEIATGGAPSVQTDVYALGILAHVLFTGAMPFDAEDTPSILALHTKAPPPRLSERRGEPVDDAIEALIARALAKDTNLRHPSASAFRYELNTVIDMLELSDRPPRIAHKERRP